MPAGCLTARLGGDEFVGCVVGVRREVDAAAYTTRMSALISRPIRLTDGDHCSVTATIGAVISQGRTPPAELLASVDRVMYRAKPAGRGNVLIVEP